MITKRGIFPEKRTSKKAIKLKNSVWFIDFTPMDALNKMVYWFDHRDKMSIDHLHNIHFVIPYIEKNHLVDQIQYNEMYLNTLIDFSERINMIYDDINIIVHLSKYTNGSFYEHLNFIKDRYFDFKTPQGIEDFNTFFKYNNVSIQYHPNKEIVKLNYGEDNESYYLINLGVKYCNSKLFKL